MSIELSAMSAQDYDQVWALWNRCEGLSQCDSRSQVEHLLQCHPELSFVARRQQEVVATILAGHDGRRGYLYHLAVDPTCRKQGLARQLVDRCLEQLAVVGIPRCSVFVYQENEEASQFWNALGWRQRAELKVFAVDL
jgi:ribosomal protein S18 acetylase RimI-like enzyme